MPVPPCLSASELTVHVPHGPTGHGMKCLYTILANGRAAHWASELRAPDRQRPASDAAAHSDYVVTNDLPLPAGGFGLGTLQQVQTFPRPRNGVALGLYRRGVAWRGHFYTTADALRHGLGLDDRHFDAFIVRHPRMRAWYIASAS